MDKIARSPDPPRSSLAQADPPRVRDPEGTKRAVLQAAERLFADRGFAGTSLRDIAVASGISHPLIQHHFETKEGLYRSVLLRCSEEYRSRFPDDPDSTGRPIDLRDEMARLFDFLRDNEPLLRMATWARLEGRPELITCGEGVRRATIRRIEAAQRAGVVRLDIDAETLAILMEGVLFHWVENRHCIARTATSPPDDDTYLARAVALLRRGFGP